MNRTQQVSRLIITLNNEIPTGLDKLVILQALSELQIRIIQTMKDDDLEILESDEAIINWPRAGQRLKDGK